ncbi:MAG: transposase [bacterium]|nr:transposase [bacterium]
MVRVARVDVGDHVYHVLNRAVGRLKIFETPADYELFLHLLREAKKMTDMRILAYAIMPNHWHLLLYPENDGDMSLFMHWLTNAHTRRVHTLTGTIGTGPLYQGRYKSFLAKTDQHLLTVLKYIERNPVRAKLSRSVESWRWGSAWLRLNGSKKQKTLLAELPVEMPHNYHSWINTPDSLKELESLRESVNRGAPFGDMRWIEQMVDTHKLISTVRKPGRPAKSIRT